MPYPSFLRLAEWDHLTGDEREDAAREVNRMLPSAFHFDGLEAHALGDQRHVVAFYTWNDRRFALIPSAETMLGFDRQRSFVPTEDQLASWRETQRKYHFELADYFEQAHSPLRQVTLRPFLLETQSVALFPPSVPQADGTVRGYGNIPVSRSATREAFASEGFRFPTSDEWEFACGAGARALFRWGDDCPMIWIPKRGSAGQWDLHLRPNTFGLVIADDPYKWEFCEEPGVMRGGDGGHALHASVGRFAEWLTLATSYLFGKHESDRVYLAHARRAYALFD